MTFGEAVREFRNCLGWSVRKAAAVAGVCETTWSAWERNCIPNRRGVERLGVAVLHAAEKEPGGSWQRSVEAFPTLADFVCPACHRKFGRMEPARWHREARAEGRLCPTCCRRVYPSRVTLFLGGQARVDHASTGRGCASVRCILGGDGAELVRRYLEKFDAASAARSTT